MILLILIILSNVFFLTFKGRIDYRKHINNYFFALKKIKGLSLDNKDSEIIFSDISKSGLKLLFILLIISIPYMIIFKYLEINYFFNIFTYFLPLVGYISFLLNKK